jgi:ABC-type sulfate transport system substrate-binding protein
VVPTVSVLAEPPVAVVDKVVLRKGTREVATAYLQYLYSKEGQEIIARNYYRPRDPEVPRSMRVSIPEAEPGDDCGLWRVAEGAGGALRRGRGV